MKPLVYLISYLTGRVIGWGISTVYNRRNP